jgi:hypothetical protein
MLVVLPAHNGDRNLAANMAAHIARLGGVKNHECLIVTPQQTNLDGIDNVLREAFGKLTVVRYTETMQGWPFGPNEAASTAMIHCAASPDLPYHYLMLEPDCVPTTRFWLDMIDMDYRRCGKPVLGVRIPTIEIATGKQVGVHTVGVAVYPKNFAQICPLVRSLVSMTSGYRNQRAMPMPWDAYFGPYTSRLTADTTLIQHLSRVRNVDEHGQVTWDCPSLENAVSQVNPQAVLVHGSKHPDFLATITVTPQPIQNHAPQIRTETNREQHQGDAQRQELRESSPPPREEKSGENGTCSLPERQPPNVAPERDYMGWSKVPKVRAKQMIASEKVRKELGISFPLNTAEFARARYFHFQMKWPAIRSYATKIGVNIFKKDKGVLINEIVNKEIVDGRESWVAELKPIEPEKLVEPLPPVALEEALPPANFGVSTTVKTAVQWKPMDANGRMIEPPTPTNITPLPDAKKEQMRRMLAERGYRVAG